MANIMGIPIFTQFRLWGNDAQLSVFTFIICTGKEKHTLAANTAYKYLERKAAQ
jgi:hypothetical protein